MVKITEIKCAHPGDYGMKFPKVFSPYPAEYNARVHGPYDPARYYGKPKVSIWDMKVGELPKNFVAADSSVKGIESCVNRCFQRYAKRILQPQKTPGALIFQVWVGLAVLHQTCQHAGYYAERHYKYHW